MANTFVLSLEKQNIRVFVAFTFYKKPLISFISAAKLQKINP